MTDGERIRDYIDEQDRDYERWSAAYELWVVELARLVVEVARATGKEHS